MRVFVGDIVKITLDGGAVPLTGYTLSIKYMRPDGTYGHWVATIDPSDNTRAYYTTATTDLDMPGTWLLQLYVVSGGTVRANGMFVDLVVLEPIALTTVPPTTVAPTTV